MSDTLESLEGEVWGEPEFSSHLVTRVHELRKKPVDQFTTEDLRIVLGQGFSAEHLVPRALSVLENDPLTQGDFYPGDLLKTVLQLPASFWAQHRDLLPQALRVCEFLLVTLQKTWGTRIEDAKSQFGASLDEESASEPIERELAVLASRFSSEHHAS